LSLKPVDGIPGDITSEQMRGVADLADRYSFGEIRVSHYQNLILPHVRAKDLFELWQALQLNGLATANIGLITDIIACPGLDYCALATARSIPIAQAITRRFADPVLQKTIGPLNLNISGCINACGHHHVGQIGILGLEKRGQESYQITIGGDPTLDAAIGDIVGPGLEAERVPEAIACLIDVYLKARLEDETFIKTFRRIGMDPFKSAFQHFVAQGEIHAA
jgi:sulfite reductase (NADPH) hemoprotein beta-component